MLQVHVQIVFARERGTKSAAGIGEAICHKAKDLKASMLLIASHGRYAAPLPNWNKINNLEPCQLATWRLTVTF